MTITPQQKHTNILSRSRLIKLIKIEKGTVSLPQDIQTGIITGT
jgi:hypothetical protein